MYNHVSEKHKADGPSWRDVYNKGKESHLYGQKEVSSQQKTVTQVTTKKSSKVESSTKQKKEPNYDAIYNLGQKLHDRDMAGKSISF